MQPASLLPLLHGEILTPPIPLPPRSMLDFATHH